MTLTADDIDQLAFAETPDALPPAVVHDAAAGRTGTRPSTKLLAITIG